MPTVRLVADTTLAPERVLEAARDFSPRRAELWPNVHADHLRVHEIGPTSAEVTERTPSAIGHIWERLRYDWSDPGSLRGVVVDSNVFRPGSTWEMTATRVDGRTRVDVVAVRHLRGIRGRLAYPAFPLGIARMGLTRQLRQFLARIEFGAERAPSVGSADE